MNNNKIGIIIVIDIEFFPSLTPLGLPNSIIAQTAIIDPTKPTAIAIMYFSIDLVVEFLLHILAIEYIARTPKQQAMAIRIATEVDIGFGFNTTPLGLPNSIIAQLAIIDPAKPTAIAIVYFSIDSIVEFSLHILTIE